MTAKVHDVITRIVFNRCWRQDGALPSGAGSSQTGAAGSAFPRRQG